MFYISTRAQTYDKNGGREFSPWSSEAIELFVGALEKFALKEHRFGMGGSNVEMKDALFCWIRLIFMTIIIIII